MSYKSISVDIINKIAHITLNRANELNTLNTDFWNGFPAALIHININAKHVLSFCHA